MYPSCNISPCVQSERGKYVHPKQQYGGRCYSADDAPLYFHVLPSIHYVDRHHLTEFHYILASMDTQDMRSEPDVFLFILDFQNAGESFRVRGKSHLERGRSF
jgi:hypothetical protein